MERLPALLNAVQAKFRTSEDAGYLIREACDDHPDLAKFENIGVSEEGRPIDAVILGKGKQHISLIAGAHSDEPVGPETLRTFILQGLQKKHVLQDLFTEYKFFIIPHINPDGEAKNQAWITQWPNIESYVQHCFRELPGRDLEFGFPDMRQENKLVSNFLKKHVPFALHISLHGMAIAEGAMLLIEKNWIDRTTRLREDFVQAVTEAGLGLHDHDRKGEKGFRYIDPGFSTTPEGQAMRDYFRSRDDEQTASLFHDSSMEFVCKLGGNPLCLVTELPLFLIGKQIKNRPAGVPAAYLELKEKLPALKAKVNRGQSIQDVLDDYQVQPIALDLLVRLQLQTIELGLEAIA